MNKKSTNLLLNLEKYLIFKSSLIWNKYKRLYKKGFSNLISNSIRMEKWLLIYY